jgi:alkylation response protein AidB-like acyl-CoA dehydrogenase
MGTMRLGADEVRGLAAAAGEFEGGYPEEYPAGTIAEFFEAGLMSAPFSEGLGGSGWSAVESARAIEVLARARPRRR